MTYFTMGWESMRKVREQVLGLPWLLLLFFMVIPSVHAADLASRAELCAFFDGAVRMQLTNHRIPGATVAVVKDGEIVFSKGYGYADLERQIPMDPEYTLHRPGSNAKILIWTAVMQLVEEGRLDLYTDINAYLDFSIPSKIARQEAPPITLHHLMTHTAGFEETVMELFVSGPEKMNSLSTYVKEHLPARVFQPGSVMAYSNYGTALAAYIVERLSGQEFHAYVEEHIFKPAQMTSSTFDQPLPDSLASRMSQGYRQDDAGFVAGGFEYVQAYPAGGLTSSTHDMARLIMTQLNLGLPLEPQGDTLSPGEENAPEGTEEIETPRILQEETARLMQAQQFSGHPEIPGMTYGLIEANYNGRRVLSHGGQTLLFSTGLYFLPEEQVGLYIAYNRAVGDQGTRILFEGFMDRYFPNIHPEPAVPRPVTPGTENNYSGIFHSARSNFTGVESITRVFQPMDISVDKEGYVVLRAQGESSRYGEIAPNLFQELHGSHKIAFGFDDGKVTRVYFPGPSTWLRTVWYQTPAFFITLLVISVLIMLVTILGWIRSLLQPYHRRQSLTAPKVLAVLFILCFITVLVLLGDAMGTTHPSLGVPLVVLEATATLKAALFFAKILMGLAALMVLTTVYLFATAGGSGWQRFYYAVYTLSSLSVTWVLWQINLF